MTYELKVSRLIPASPDEVFDAYVDPEKQKIWYTLLETEPMIVEVDVDLRVGGVWNATWGYSQDQLFREVNVFKVIDRPNRILTTSTGTSPDGDSIETEIDVTFEAQDGGTLMTVHQTGFPTEEQRDFFTTIAWNGLFDRLTEFFSRDELRR